jgi:hypothetical protein
MNSEDIKIIAETARNISGYRRVRLEATPYYLHESWMNSVPLPSEDFLDWEWVKKLTIPNEECWLDIAVSTYGTGGELIDNALCRFVGGRVVEIRATHTTGKIAWEKENEMTTAERIARRFNDDGQTFEVDGIQIIDACRDTAPGVPRVNRAGDSERYEFRDGSAIVISGGGWSIGFPSPATCHCWLDANYGKHNGDCTGFTFHYTDETGHEAEFENFGVALDHLILRSGLPDGPQSATVRNGETGERIEAAAINGRYCLITSSGPGVYHVIGHGNDW